MGHLQILITLILNINILVLYYNILICIIVNNNNNKFKHTCCHWILQKLVSYNF